MINMIKIICLLMFLICSAGPVFGGADQDNHANQMNPNNDAYWESRGYDERPDDWQERSAQDNSRQSYLQKVLDNHLKQKYPNNDAYCKSRDYDIKYDNSNVYNTNKSVNKDLNYDYEPLHDGTKQLDEIKNCIKTTSDYYKALIFRMKTPEVKYLSNKQKIDLSRKLADLTEYTCKTLYPFENDKLIQCMANFSMKMIIDIDKMTKYVYKTTK